MSKFQKIAFGVFVALSLVFAVIGYRSLKNIKQPSVKAITLIPDSCEVLVKFDNYSEFTDELRNKNLLWQDLQFISCFTELAKKFNYFDSLLLSQQNLNELISGNPVYFSLYKNRQFLITANLKELADENMYKDAFAKISASFNSVGLKTEIQSGVIGISNSEEQLKKLFNTKNFKLNNNKNYKIAVEAANYSGTSIYISTGTTLFKNSLSNISIRPDKIILNGIKQNDSTEFVGDIDAAPSKNFDFLYNIPLICNAFEVFVINDAESLFEQDNELDWWANVNEKAMFKAKKQFYNNLNSRIVKVTMPSKDRALILAVSDSVKMAEVLPFLNDTLKSGNKRICRLLKGASSFVGSTFPLIKINELKYFAAFKNYLVFTASESDAEIFVNANDNKSSILENKRFKQFAGKNFDSEFHYLNYKLINASAKDEIIFSDQLKENDLSKLKNISHCSYMAVYKNNFLNYRFNLSYNQENFSDEPNVLWTMKADTTISSKPFLFKNHITKGNEVIFQTIDNRIYLQNATGKNLWKKQINEQIRSEIFIVDAFKNGKYQMLFNSEKYLHLIDRNGNYVQGFPVKLPAKATNKLCLFDYENKNDLRLFIACADNRIYNYDVLGTKHEGFKTMETSAEVILPIKYCKVGLSDYLVTSDTKGKIYAFSRKGDGRIDFKNKLIEDAENFEVESGNLLSNTQIIYFDKKNNLIEKISLADKKEIYKSSESDGRSAYCFGDYDRNKITDVIIACSEKAEVYDLNGSKITGIDILDNINPLEVNFYDLNNQGFISIFDEINSNCLVLNAEQKINKENKSTKPVLICDLFNDGKIYVVSVLNGELKCLKL